MEGRREGGREGGREGKRMSEGERGLKEMKNRIKFFFFKLVDLSCLQRMS